MANSVKQFKVWRFEKDLPHPTYVCTIELDSAWFDDSQFPNIIQLPNGELCYKYLIGYVVESGYYLSQSDLVKNVAVEG